MLSRGRAETRASAPTFAQVLRTGPYLPIFLANALSTWGDFIARITLAAVVLDRTGSAFASAATFAVSLVPTVFGRTLLSPLADRIPYRDVLIGSHLVRAVIVVGLMLAVAAESPILLLLGLLFTLELFGGPTAAASQMLMTDIFEDRRLFAKAYGLSSLAEQCNQAIGLVVGGAAVALLGPQRGLLFDLGTFLVAAVVLRLVLPRTSINGEPRHGVRGFLHDMADGGRHLMSNRLLTSLLGLSLVSMPAIAAPEAVALPFVRDESNTAALGGLFMAAPILGAAAGVVLMSRWAAERQNARLLRLAIAMPIPLLATVVHPPLAVVWGLWFASGLLQTFMLPLQSTFSLLVRPEMRGRVFGLGGALSVTCTGLSYLFAGWVSQHTTPAAAVGVCAVISLGGAVLLAGWWPRAEMDAAVARTYGSADSGVDPATETGAGREVGPA